jgi:hypothetical protein
MDIKRGMFPTESIRRKREIESENIAYQSITYLYQKKG